MTAKLENLGLIVRRLITLGERTVYSFYLAEGLNAEKIGAAIDEKTIYIANFVREVPLDEGFLEVLPTSPDAPTISEILQQMIQRIVYLEAQIFHLESYLLLTPQSKVEPSKLLEMLHSVGNQRAS